MQESAAVAAGISRFYEAFSAADTAAFGAVIADGPGVSVIGSAPGEGHQGRTDWVATYDRSIRDLGVKLEGAEPRGWQRGSVGFGVDEPRFVMPDGRYLPTRLTAVLESSDGDWKVVHLHFSVGVPDEEAIRTPNA